MFAIIKTYDGRHAQFVMHDGCDVVVARTAEQKAQLIWYAQAEERGCTAICAVIELPDSWPFQNVQQIRREWLVA